MAKTPKRYLLIGKKVLYKFPIDIASKLSAFHAVNWWIMFQPKNGQLFEWTQTLDPLKNIAGSQVTMQLSATHTP